MTRLLGSSSTYTGMAMLRFSGSNTAAILVTSPTFTPLNSTGEPTDSPVIEPEKYSTQV
jgi:hypothetical protein